MSTFRPFSERKAAKAEHDLKKRRYYKGRWWLAPRAAKKLLAKAGIRVSEGTLRRWANVSCPWLNGEKLDSEPIPGGYGRTHTYYAEDGIKDIIKAKEAQERIPKYPGLTYQGDACAKLSCSAKQLRRMMKSHNPPVEMVKKPGKSKDGRGLPRSYVPTTFVSEAKRLRYPPSADDTITTKEASEILGCSLSHVYTLMSDGLLTPLPGRTTGSYQQKRNGRDTTQWGVRGKWRLLRAEVNEAKVKGVWPPRSPNLDPTIWKNAEEIADGQGLPASDWWRRCALYSALRQKRETDPSIAQRVWFLNKAGRWQSTRWKYDVTRLGAMPATAENVTEAPATNAIDAGSRGRPGRPYDDDTEEMQEWCYDVYHDRKVKLENAVIEARRRFPEWSWEKSNITKYARRYAKRKCVSFTPRTGENTTN